MNRWRIAGWGGAALVLLLPLAAMQVTGDVAWDKADFIVFGIMLAAASAAFELAVRMTDSAAVRAAIGIALAVAFILVWLHLAVGIV